MLTVQRSSLILVVLLAVTGCVTYRGHFGYTRTDLSRLHLGMHKEEIEAIVHEPIELRTIEDNALAIYEVDRGYIPPAEEEDLSPVWTVPFSLLLDAASFGTLGYCESKCQKGRLAVLFDSSSCLLEALEYPLSSQERGPCWQGDSRDHCVYVEHHPRPSTLSQPIPHQQLQRPLAE